MQANTQGEHTIDEGEDEKEGSSPPRCTLVDTDRGFLSLGLNNCAVKWRKAATTDTDEDEEEDD